MGDEQMSRSVVSPNEVRSVHPYGFRSGEWAQIVACYDGQAGKRAQMLVRFADGVTDTWVVEDPSDEREYR